MINSQGRESRGSGFETCPVPQAAPLWRGESPSYDFARRRRHHGEFRPRRPAGAPGAVAGEAAPPAGASCQAPGPGARRWRDPRDRSWCFTAFGQSRRPPASLPFPPLLDRRPPVPSPEDSRFRASARFRAGGALALGACVPRARFQRSGALCELQAVMMV